jgi:hypothetical protein
MPEVRVAHVLPVYAAGGINLLGGGERYVVNLVRHLAASCDVTLVTFGRAHHETEVDGFHHLVLPTLGGPADNPTPRTPFLWLRRFDIVHAHQLRTATSSIPCRGLSRNPPSLVATDLG